MRRSACDDRPCAGPDGLSFSTTTIPRTSSIVMLGHLRVLLRLLLVSLLLTAGRLSGVTAQPNAPSATPLLHWPFDSMDSSGAFPELLQGDTATLGVLDTAHQYYANGYYSYPADAGLATSAAAFGAGSYFNNPFEASCSVGQCVDTDLAVLLVSPAPLLIDLSNGWSFSFWHRALPDAGYGTQPNAQVIFTDEGSEGNWTQQVSTETHSREQQSVPDMSSPQQHMSELHERTHSRPLSLS